LIPAFERVVTDGTGRAAAVSGLRIAGKTGTAQKTINGTYARGKYRASFVGFFPADDPQVAIVVILDEPSKSGYGGVVAAPIFGRIARRWVSADPSLAMPNTPHDIVDSGPRIEVPEITSRPLAVAVSQLVASGLKVDGYNAGADPFALVALHEPVVGTKVPRETEVELSVNATPLLSDAARGQLKGLSCRHAVNWLIAGNNAVRVRGTGRVHRVAQDGHRTVVYCR